jgi:hypothetical protein
MNTGALAIMLTTWAVIITFTLYYFIKVVRTPQEKGAETKKAAPGAQHEPDEEHA